MEYSEAIHYLYSALPMFSRTGAKAVKLDLAKTKAICEHLGSPEKKFLSVHVAGTNGKGSVCNMLAAIFQIHGYKTGLYTSPHLHDFRERIRINGRMVPESFVIDFVEKNRSFAESVRPSFFELTFGMAMDYFAREQVDMVIIETGLGGRLDSTNVVVPELSVITNIGWDHMDILGDTLEKIAMEKAGIIKKNVPVLIGETQAETKDVFNAVARMRSSSIVFADQNFRIVHKQTSTNGTEGVSVKQLATGEVITYHPDLTGIYQDKNLITVLAAAQLLKQPFKLENERIKEALSKVCLLTGFEGRWQVIRRNPLVIMDVAHNADGIRQVMNHLTNLSYGHLHIITGMVKDKDIRAVLQLLPAEAKYYFTNAHIPRALPAVELKEKAAQYHLAGENYDDVNDALSAALQEADAEDLILICGSVFVIGEVQTDKIKTAL